MGKKYFVRHRVSGIERDMTESSFKLAGEKRGWVILHEVKPKAGEKSIVQQEMDRLRAEQAAKIVSETKDEVSEDVDTTSEVKEVKRRGPKPKKNEE
jgi:hypothetical protein